MRQLRPVSLFFAMALLAVACSTPSGSASESPGGGGNEPTATPDGGGSEATATPDGGGGGGGGGANGSFVYQITGDYEASGELPFLAGGVSVWYEAEGGWIANFANPSGEGAVVNMNTGVSTDFVLVSFGDGTALVVATNDSSTGYDCTFTEDKNDASGLKGSLDCSNTAASNVNTGALLNVNFTAQWDAHP